MMADDLTKEEKEAAAKLESASEGEKSQLEKIADNTNSMTELLKSQVEAKKDEAEVEKKDDDIDYSSITPEDMAKSFADKDKAFDFIKGFCEYADVQPVDMQHEDGTKLISEEMWKSMQEATDDDMGVKSAIMFSMQEAGERNVQINSTILHSLVGFGKGLSALTAEVIELKKSLAPPVEKTDAEKEAEKIAAIPNLDDAAGDPKTKDMTKSTGADGVIEETMLLKSIDSVFVGSWDKEAQAKGNTYKTYVRKTGSIEAALTLIGQDSSADLALIKSHLPLN